jgi:hypothetical protein
MIAQRKALQRKDGNHFTNQEPGDLPQEQSAFLVRRSEPPRGCAPNAVCTRQGPPGSATVGAD